MSSKIRVLDEETINKIAAGEVIENPSSVVKELVENSIDAGSTEITIEIKGGGRQLIRITDNGCGMNKDDALLCLERHATSKLKEIDEIHSLDTMGFRGEAIPSIASISKFTLYTRVNAPHAAPSSGTLIIVNGGKIITCSEVECAMGTTIEIKDLFFNVPVRKKFQKSPSYDIAEIQRIVTQLSLGNPHVNFQLISNGQVVISAPHIDPNAPFADALKERVRHLLGSDFHQNLIPIQACAADYRLEGFIGLPSAHRHNRSGQHLFINRRGVVVPLISFSMKDGYGTMLPSGRHPIFVLHMTMPPDLIDVNVHPQKREVRLRQERLIRDLILSSVQQSLLQSNFSLDAAFPPSDQPVMGMGYSPAFTPSFLDQTPAWNPPTLDPFACEENYPLYLKPALETCEPPAENQALEPLEGSFEASSPQASPPSLPRQESFNFQAEVPPQPAVHAKRLNAIGLIEKYIIALEAQGSSELYLIDQRAAHERIIYEKILDSAGQHIQEQQLLLIPHLINLTVTEAAFLRDQLDSLFAAGIQLKEFGPTSFMLEALPQAFGNVDVQKLIDEIIKCSYENIDPQILETEKKRRLAQAASRAAIASNTRLSLAEAQHILDQLMNCKQPKLRPNGKSSMISLNANDIAKLAGQK